MLIYVKEFLIFVLLLAAYVWTIAFRYDCRIIRIMVDVFLAVYFAVLSTVCLLNGTVAYFIIFMFFLCLFDLALNIFKLNKD